MRFIELNPPIIELAAGQVFHRVQLIRPRSNSVLLNGLSLPPVGLRHGRFCLADGPVAYLADSAETALYESLLRRETVSRSLADFTPRCLVEFASRVTLRLADLRELAEPYPVLQSMRVAHTQAFAADCHSRGLDGVLYASAQHPHHACTALFSTGIHTLVKRNARRLVKQGSSRLLMEAHAALWRSGVPLVG
jgi:hypothetical protein